MVRTKTQPNVYNEHLPELRKEMMKHYIEFIDTANKSIKDPLCQQILSTSDKLRMEHGMDENEALRKVADMSYYIMDIVLPSIVHDLLPGDH